MTTELNQAELAQTLFEESGDALFLFEPETERVLDANPMAQRMSGYSHKELLERPVTYFFRSEMQGGLHNLRLACRKTGPFHSQEGYLLRQKADRHWVPVNLTVCRLHAEPRTLGLITVRDISDRRKAQKELEKKESELRQVLSSVSASVWSLQLDDHGRCIDGYCSPVIEEITGYSLSFFEGRHDAWMEIIHPDHRQVVADAFQRLRAGTSAAEECEYPIIRPDGEIVWVHDSILARRHPENGSIRLDGILSNISDRMRAQTLSQSRRTTLEMIINGVELTSIFKQIALTIEQQSPGLCAEVVLHEREQSEPTIIAPALANEQCELVRELARESKLGQIEQQPMSVIQRKWGEHRSLALRAQFHACWSISMHSPDDQIEGEIYVLCTRCDELSDADRHLLELSARLSTVSLETARARAALSASQGRYEHLLRSTSGEVTIVNAQGRVLYRVGENRVEHPTNQCFSDQIHPDDCDAAHQALARLVQTPGATITLQFRARSKESRWTEMICQNLLDDPLFRGIVIHSNDVTERVRWQQTQERLRENEARSVALLENLEQAIFFKGPDLRFVQVNRPFCRALDRDEEEVLGKSDFDLYPRELAEKYRADDQRVLEQGERLEAEEETLILGETRTVRTVKTPMRDEQGKIRGVLGIYWDVTDQRLLESQLRHAARMEAVGQLAGGLAHDFNNMLTIVLGNLTLLLSGEEVEESPEDLMRKAEQAANRATELTQQLLTFSKQGSSQPRPARLTKIIDEVASLIGPTLSPQIRISINHDPQLWLCDVDVGQIHQVLLNLCLNARDAIGEKGGLLLETWNHTITGTETRSNLQARSGDFVRVRVRDTGCGMDEETRARIFDPFFTTKGKDGTGLGLSQAFGIVQQHQGWIECKSEVEVGTTFDIYFPRSSALDETTVVPVPEVLELKSAGRETILLVDDEPLILSVGRTFLEQQGYQVLLAESGNEALEIYREKQSEVQLVIVDLTMPGLSGQETLRELVDIDSSAKVLIASGYSETRLNEQDRKISAGFISKPYRLQEMASLIRTTLDR